MTLQNSSLRRKVYKMTLQIKEPNNIDRCSEIKLLKKYVYPI